MNNRIAVLISLLFCLFASPKMAQANDSTRVFTPEHPLVYEDAWDLWPYSFLNASGEAVGYNIDLVKLICQELDIPYVIKLKPTSKALSDLRSGEADLMLAMEADYHDEFAHYGESVVQIFTHSVLHRKGEPARIVTENDLSKYPVIVHEGSFSHHLMEDKGWEQNAIPYNDMREAVQYVHNTPNCQIVWNTLSLKWLIRTLHFDNLELTPVNMRHGDYKFLSNDTQLLKQIDEIYTLLESEGKLQAIQNKWFYPERKDSGVPSWIWPVVIVLVLVVICATIYYIIYRNREKKMTKTIRRSNNRLSLIMKTNKIRIWTFNVGQKTVTLYDENCQVEAANQSPTFFFQRVQAEDVQRISDALLKISEGEEDKITLEVRSKDKKDGGYRILAIVLTPLRYDRYGQTTDIVGTTSDITATRRRQEQVKNTKLRYESIFNSPMVDTITFDEFGYIDNMNETAATGFPVERDQIQNRQVHLRDLFGEPMPVENMQPIHMTRFYNPDIDTSIYRNVLHDKVYYELQLMPLRDKDNKLKAIFGTGRDVSEVVKSYQRLRENLAQQERANEAMNAYFRNINFVLQNGGVRMAVYYPDTHILLIYSSVGQEQNQLTQNRALALTDPESKKQAERMINSMDNHTLSPLKAAIKTTIRGKHGKRLTLLLSFIPTLDDNNEVVEYFGVCRDISEIKATEEELARETVKAQEIETVKNAFLRNMSYEIRTPLSSVVGFAELFEMSHTSEDEPLFIEQIKHNSSRLLKLINDILFLSRLDAQMIEFRRQPIDFSQIFEARCQTAWFHDQHEGVSYVVDNPYHQLVVEIDEGNIGKVIDQLVSNAAQNTRMGMVRASYEYTGEDLVMVFQDTGCGISSERLNQIFERFVTSGNQGTGLGLSICHELVRQMGGKIKIKSNEGQGTIVWVTIPCKCTEIVRK